jgi:2,3-bisphosphoglycerate-dependent phosphoglycerate mutase
MRKTLFSLFLFTLIFTQSYSQDQKITTFILVRHAEKVADGSQDPDLSQAGIERSIKLAELLKNTKIDAVYSTNFKRTRNTVSAIAKEKSLEVKLYESSKPTEIDKMISENSGKTILVSGHSNTIPGIANQLIGKNEYQNFPDGEYGNIIIVSFVEKGKSANVIWMNY